MTPRPARRARPAAAPAAALLLLLAARGGLRSVAALDGAPPPAPALGRIVGPGSEPAPAAGAVVGVMTAANRPEDAYLYCTGSLIAPDGKKTTTTRRRDLPDGDLSQPP